MPPSVIVVPCYNEARRLHGELLRELTRPPGARLLLVDDGSTDETLAALGVLAGAGDGRIEVLPLGANHGKGEAVRRGMLAALADGAEVVGYADADLSTPVAEILRLLEELDGAGADAVIGSRVALLGADIQRSAVRHYLGRLFATGASLVLGMLVYDTQCGAKFFRRTPALEAALARPFRSRWAFDVELIGRLVAEADGHPHRIIEVPLRAWRDAAGSKLAPMAMARAALDLVWIARDLARWRRARAR